MTPDEHRALYFLEKARRAERPNPKLDAAKREFDAQLQRERDARKGGRPRAMHSSFGKHSGRKKVIDLTEGLDTFTGNGAA